MWMARSSVQNSVEIPKPHVPEGLSASISIKLQVFKYQAKRLKMPYYSREYK